LLLDDDTVREWHKEYKTQGIHWLKQFGYKGRQSLLTQAQQEKLKAWATEHLPRSTNIIGAKIAKDFELDYTRSAIIKLMARLGFEWRKPKSVSKKLSVEKQKAFIEEYEKLLKTLNDDEVVLLVDAVHPTHEARPVGCWAPKKVAVAIDQTSGRDRMNIHGAINLETGLTKIIERLTIDATSTIALFTGIENQYPKIRKIHLFLDNAKYHHAEIVQTWMKKPERRIVLHFIPPYCAHLDSIERLWGVMHKNVTHNTSYKNFKEFADTLLHFLRVEIPKNWHLYRDSITDNFRIINPDNFRII
jgi:transposase